MPNKDPEARRAYMKAYAEKNREQIKENQRRYQEKNREKEQARQREWYRQNREKVLRRESDRYWGDPEVRKAKSERAKQWALANPERDRTNRRRAWAKRLYGLTLEELDALLASGCVLCGSTENLHVDHCHGTGKVRGALCLSCNTSLGKFGDDPARLRAAADYLEGHA